MVLPLSLATLLALLLWPAIEVISNDTNNGITTIRMAFTHSAQVLTQLIFVLVNS